MVLDQYLHDAQQDAEIIHLPFDGPDKSGYIRKFCLVGQETRDLKVRIDRLVNFPV